MLCRLFTYHDINAVQFEFVLFNTSRLNGMGGGWEGGLRRKLGRGGGIVGEGRMRSGKFASLCIGIAVCGFFF